MTTSNYAPTQAPPFASIYGQPGFFGQPGYEQQTPSPLGMTSPLQGQQLFGQPGIGLGTPQLFGGAQQYGIQPQFGAAQQFGIQPQLGGLQQFGGVEQAVAIIAQVVPQLLAAAHQNLTIAQHLMYQVVQQIAQAAVQGQGARQPFRPYGMIW